VKILPLFHCNTEAASTFIAKHKIYILVFRLQVFHCLHHDGEGGETLLVDGFRAAYDLKQTHPKSFQRLSTLPIEAEYVEAGKHYTNVDSMLKLHPLTKKLQQIR
jgi:alpha-ketoglutarate-dependent taurine dioxygenase